jgi:hypothetical protein
MGDGSVTRGKRRRKWIALAALALAVWIAREFLTSLLWALVLAVALWPLLRGMRPDRSGNTPIWAALGLTLATGLVLMLPLVVAAFEAAQESGVAMAWMQQAQATGIPSPLWLSDLPLVGSRLHELWQRYLASPAASGELLAQLDAATILNWVKGAALAMAQDTLLLFVTLVALFTLLHRGASLGARGTHIIARSVGHGGEAFAERMVDAVRVTVVGTVFVALGEGAPDRDRLRNRRRPQADAVRADDRGLRNAALWCLDHVQHRQRRAAAGRRTRRRGSCLPLWRRGDADRRQCRPARADRQTRRAAFPARADWYFRGHCKYGAGRAVRRPGDHDRLAHRRPRMARLSLRWP